MTATEQITDRLQKLPPQLQREVLDFIEFLAQRVGQDEATSEEADWMRFSLGQALKGLDDEESEYTDADVKEKWQ
jgi:hypothetical protein